MWGVRVASLEEQAKRAHKTGRNNAVRRPERARVSAMALESSDTLPASLLAPETFGNQTALPKQSSESRAASSSSLPKLRAHCLTLEVLPLLTHMNFLFGSLPTRISKHLTGQGFVKYAATRHPTASLGQKKGGTTKAWRSLSPIPRVQQQMPRPYFCSSASSQFEARLAAEGHYLFSGGCARH